MREPAFEIGTIVNLHGSTLLGRVVSISTEARSGGYDVFRYEVKWSRRKNPALQYQGELVNFEEKVLKAQKRADSLAARLELARQSL